MTGLQQTRKGQAEPPPMGSKVETKIPGEQEPLISLNVNLHGGNRAHGRIHMTLEAKKIRSTIPQGLRQGVVEQQALIVGEVQHLLHSHPTQVPCPVTAKELYFKKHLIPC